MLSNNFAVYGTKIIAELIRDIIYFPLWWYSRGLVLTTKGLIEFLAARQKSLGLLVWVKNIHRPMYGQRDWVGKLISFFMRLIQVIVRSIIMLFWVAVVFIFLCFWLALPPLVIIEIIYQVMPS